jgi:hypothetical protein
MRASVLGAVRDLDPDENMSGRSSTREDARNVLPAEPKIASWSVSS